MWVLDDIADWWDRQRQISERGLEDFVDEYPNWFGVVVAGSTATAMDLGAGLVDVLRLGEGVKEGGLKGYGKDALRLLQFAPAAGKLGRSFLARVLVNPPGGVCTWVSATKALRQVGAKAFASVDELAVAAGFKSISELGGAFVNEALPALKRLGARVTDLGKVQSMENVVAKLGREGVALFSVEWEMAGQKVGHTLYAFKDLLGRIRIADRSGKVVGALSELEHLYKGIGSAKVYGTAALVEGAQILIVDGLGVLSMELRAVLLVDPETAAQTLEARKIAAKSGSHDGALTPVSPAVRAPVGIAHAAAEAPRSPKGVSPASGSGQRGVAPARTLKTRGPGPVGDAAISSQAGINAAGVHIVRKGDWLSKLAAKYYGRQDKWIVLYEANRRIIGSNPDLIIPGQRLVIPPLSPTSARSNN